ncbi:hypothetical protein CAEBREN_11583 [Caenorhabditis brenneri]|uniref:MKRN2 opposite strand protein-like C-terminal domain-containing protein n=1 Tax=Caenorhabditis brenneri TaxID=135651 RepID=G0N4T8_CAEBE|nr:hypothetical protein CAEBREN_11583 [Caenorhabditis brenneri]
MKIIVIYHDGCPTSILGVDPPSSTKKCPTCEAKIDFKDQKWSIKPLPSPISETQKETAGCIVVKPSHGNIQSYSFGKDLHIGISDSNGQVYSFWTKGVETQKTTWGNSVVLIDLRPYFFGNLKNLDNCIEFFIETQKMSLRFHKSKYRETTWNCFDFVLEFLKFINFRNYKAVDFSEEFTTKKMQGVVKYITLYNKLLNEN